MLPGMILLCGYHRDDCAITQLTEKLQNFSTAIRVLRALWQHRQARGWHRRIGSHSLICVLEPHRIDDEDLFQPCVQLLLYRFHRIRRDKREPRLPASCDYLLLSKRDRRTASSCKCADVSCVQLSSHQSQQL